MISPSSSQGQSSPGDKPSFDHPQNQTPQPVGQVFGAQTDLEGVQILIQQLREDLDRKIRTHIHNGNEAPRINANTDILGWKGGLVFMGTVSSGGVLTSPLPLLNWSATESATGVYVITHNLGTTNYSIVATPQDKVVVLQIVSKGANTVGIDAWAAQPTPSAVNAAFDFFIATYLP